MVEVGADELRPVDRVWSGRTGVAPFGGQAAGVRSSRTVMRFASGKSGSHRSIVASRSSRPSSESFNASAPTNIFEMLPTRNASVWTIGVCALRSASPDTANTGGCSPSLTPTIAPGVAALRCHSSNVRWRRATTDAGSAGTVVVVEVEVDVDAEVDVTERLRADS